MGPHGRLIRHLGFVGRFIGGGPEKPGNIAVVVILASFVVLILGGSVAAYTQSERIAAVFGDLVTGGVSLITGALGYIFGKGSKDSE